MIKRLLIIGTFTGAAHITTLVILKKLTGLLSLDDIKAIGQIDSLINFILNILASGLLMTSVREIAISENWQRFLIHSQQARFSLSILLLPLALFSLLDPSFILFAFAPVFALHADYALYGKGLPVTAAVLAFCRVFLPFVALLTASIYWPNSLISVFITSSVILYFLSGVAISAILKIPFIISPSIQSLKLYISSIPLGIVSFVYYFLGLGIIIIADLFYTAKVVAIAYVAIKLYVIFKGVLRILNQTFIADMTDDEVCHKVDYLAFSAGTIFLAATSLFVNGFRDLFIDKRSGDSNDWVYMIGISCFLISPLISLTMKAILEKKDKSYAAISIVALAVSVISCCLFSWILPNEGGILLSIILGELFCITGLLQILKKWSWLKQRFIFLFRNLPLLIIPVLFRVFAGDNKFVLIFSMFLYGILLLFLNRKTFWLQTQKKSRLI